MAEVVEDRVQESTTSTGTGALTLAGATTSYRTFSSVCSVGDQFYGVIVAVDSNGAPTGAWETGHYTYSAANTITRTTVSASSNSNAAVSFAAGVKRVFIDLTAAQVAQFQSSGSLTGNMPYGQTASLYAPTPVFTEEFNGNALDTNVWNNAIYYATSDATINYNVANGSLSLWPSTGFVARTIDTDGKFYLNPGCFVEAKIKAGTGLGATPAFWLYAHDAAAHPGVTIAKFFSGDTTTPYANSSYHPIDYKMSVDSDDAVNVGSIRAGSTLTVPDLSLAYHIYGVKWESTGFTFYLDGVQVGSKITATFAARMYIVLSLWFTAAAPNGTPTTTNTPTGQGNSTAIDYVRAWILK